ncbi:MAG: baseplate J/gp47 family protein [Opitutaceae bacterium]|jgi:uncharacterized phage protein gp47/JayE|nr:baseplate J/gp47 family protein [Opitutaceae bacterium]
MPNALDLSGLTVKTLAEITAAILDGDGDAPGLRDIYGEDISVDSDTPDGQLVNIFALAVKDQLDLLRQIYNSFDPDLAIGRALDQRCAINGVSRRGATYTQTIVEVTTDRPVTLAGLDAASPFTVSDAEGNRFVLKSTTAIPGAGTRQLDFRAEEPGAVIVRTNTLTNPLTIILGVTGIINPYLPYGEGVNEESDAALRVRRAYSIALPNQGYIDGMIAALRAVPGVTAAFVYENTSATADADAVPAHSIWAIVEGGLDTEVARALYLKRNAGCGMKKGSITIPVLQPNGTTFDITFDRPVQEELWIKFNIATTTGGGVDEIWLRTRILEGMEYGIYQIADTSSIIAFIKGVLPDSVVTSAGVSLDGTTYAETQTPSAKNNKFAIERAHIIINGHDE